MQKYLDEHELQPKLNSLLNELVHELPEDPLTWMADKIDTNKTVHTIGTHSSMVAQDPRVNRLWVQWDRVAALQTNPALISCGEPKPEMISETSQHPSTASASVSAVPSAISQSPVDAGKAAKKAAKAEEKLRKEEEKERRRKERDEAQRRKADGPEVPQLTLLNYMEHTFGELMIQSHKITKPRSWASVNALDAQMCGQSIWLRVRLQNSRKPSAKLGFLVLRQRLATVQAVVQGKDLAAFACGLPRESVVDMLAQVNAPPEPITACSQSEVELVVTRLYCISKAQTRLPLQLEDAGRSESEMEALKLPRVDQSTRLDNRVIDLRTQANQGILRIQSQVCALFREFLAQKGFTEIHSPKMIATASEGGADVFRLSYFDRYAYLAQSPQLYKQMALMADLGSVFEIGPVFRSEKSYTHRHMTEFTGLDLEMTFKDDYHEVLDVLEELFLHIFEGINSRCKSELEAVGSQFPFTKLRFERPPLRMRFDEAVALLRLHGPKIGQDILDDLEAQVLHANASGSVERVAELSKLANDAREHLSTVPSLADDEDLSTRDEKLLGAVVARTKGTDFYVIDKFPTAIRPFYTMPDPLDSKWSNSYDIFIRGEEVTSGAQRIHDPSMLLENGKRLGVELGPIKDYVDSFQYGAFPHAGGGIGLERVVMLFLGLDNIRKTSMFPRDPSRLTP